MQQQICNTGSRKQVFTALHVRVYINFVHTELYTLNTPLNGCSIVVASGRLDASPLKGEAEGGAAQEG
eukprot:scaffold191776_cov18-Tisochrysis_lutea.AAC.2